MGAAEPIPSGPARHPLVARILAPSSAEALRLGAARGALPMPMADLLYVQVRLLSDPAAAVAAAARDTLERTASGPLGAALSEPACDPAVLDHFARSGRLAGESLAVVIAHPAVEAATLEALAGGGDAATLNLIITNEVRVVASRALRDALRSNPRLAPDDRRRLAELERDVVGREHQGPRPAPAAAAADSAADAAPVAGAGAPPSEGGEASWPPGEPGAPGEGEAIPAPDPEAEALAEEALRNSPAFQRIMQLNVAERNVLAMKGSSEERAILIRDTAKMVALAVLKNPRLSDTEITTYAGMRNVHEDILRVIARSREWTKNYAVTLALVRNPKTPPGLSAQFLGRLGTRDLKITAGDKNIPELVRRNARNLFIARTQPPKRTAKKAH